MTNRSVDVSSKGCCSPPETKLNQHIRNKSISEGCPVIDERGTVCGETDSLSIFKEFRKIYEECLKKLAENSDGGMLMKKLAPFRKLVEDLWQQNNMLVQAVEELEQEATCQVTNLQIKLDKSCQKEMHCMLKAKEREVQGLNKSLSEKDELLKNYCCQIESLKKDVKLKSKQYTDLLRQFKSVTRKDSGKSAEENDEESEENDATALGESINRKMIDLENERNLMMMKVQNAECQIHLLTAEKKKLSMENNEVCNKLKSVLTEKEDLKNLLAQKNVSDLETEGLIKLVDQLKYEKNELLKKMNVQNDNIQELIKNFKEISLISGVAEKHDQIQELRRCLRASKDRLRQADKQIQFKDDIIKELTNELKTAKKSGPQQSSEVANKSRRKKNLKNENRFAGASSCHSNDNNNKNKRDESIKTQSMNPCLDGPDSGFYSANFASEREENNGDDSGSSKRDKLQSQLECLKNFLKTQTEDLRAQQELTKDLEEELEATKLSLSALQEKCEIQNRRRNAPTNSSFSDPGLCWRYGNLHSAVSKVEETLRNLSKKHSCGLSDCKLVIEEEIEKINSVKNDLKYFERCKSKNQLSGYNNPSSSSQQIVEIDSVGNFDLTDSCQDSQMSRCNLLHLKDVESFREKSVTGVAILEEMKEQIDILENLVRKYVESFPCGCDKNTFFSCEEKLECLRGDFNDITDQLCSFLHKCNASNLEEICNEDSLVTCCEMMRVKGQGSVNPDDEFLIESVSELRSDYQRLQKEIRDMENEIEKLQQYSRQMDEELEGKRVRLSQQNRDLDVRMCEIEKVKDLMEKISRRLQQTHNGISDDVSENAEIISPSNNNGSNLRSLFSAMNEFCCVLEKTKEILYEAPRLQEENEKLREKLCSLEKCICNKEKTLKVLQDTVRVRECQIQEIKCKIETSENEASKLTQDVEEKCRLIASLQEALRKCKQFQVHARSAQLESMEFKICELDNRLKESEKEVLAKDKTMENLQGKILTLYLKNFALNQEINIIEPRLKSMYKNCHTFEKMVNDLQAELNVRECEVDGLCGKIKELEEELDSEFRKCESRALEDSKCIEELCAAVKNFQSELCFARENSNKTIAEAEKRLLKEREMNKEKESEFRDEIRQLNMEIECLRNQLQESARNERNSRTISDLESVVKEAESRRSSYDKKITELQNLLECTMLEHEEERKNILQKLCEEKKENVRNKTLITKLNENMKRKILNEKSLKESIKHFTEDTEILRKENQELKTEVEVRKKIMNSMERNENTNLTELEDLLGQVKLQKADVKSRCSDLRAELDKEVKLKRLLESRVEDLNTMLESKLHEFDEMVQNYKCTSSKLQQTLTKLKQAEEKSCCVEKRLRQELDSCHEMSENECLKKIIDMKTAENGKLFSQLLVAKVEMESLQTEYFATLADKDCLISRLKYEGSCFEKNFEDILNEYLKLEEDNKRIQEELNRSNGKIFEMQTEFREKQKDLCSKLRSTMVEKNEYLNSVDKLQKQLEHICLENVNKDEMNRELAKECSRLKINSDASDKNLKKKSDKIICNLNKEVNSLQCELGTLKENYNSLNEEYQNALEQLSLMEKKKSNLEKLYLEVNNECGELQELKMRMEKELCEIKSQNMMLRDKIASMSKAESSGSSDDKNLRNKLRELTMKIKTLEGRVIPELEQEISEKNYCIQNLKEELREANISSQRMRNEALRVIQHTKKYLAAQRCANETLKSRLECSNKRGNILGAENRDLEEQLKAVTRMNEFLLRQLESSKSEVNEAENNSFSPLPWGCATVERDTSSSEYLAESGIQSMQQSPTNLDCNTCDCKHQDPCKWNNAKRNKHCGSAEYPTCRSNVR